MSFRFDRAGGLTVVFSVGESPTLVLRRLELLESCALNLTSGRGVVTAAFPADAACCSGGGALLHVEISGTSQRSTVRLRMLATASDSPTVEPPHAARRDDLRIALREILDERLTSGSKTHRPLSSCGVCYWTLSTLSLFGMGEDFLLRLRRSGLRLPILDRWSPGPIRLRRLAVPAALSLLAGAAYVLF